MTEKGHDYDENLALSKQFLAEKQQLWLRELCWKAFSINLHGKEDGVHRDYEEIEVGLSNIAGNLSPRMVVQ